MRPLRFILPGRFCFPRPFWAADWEGPEVSRQGDRAWGISRQMQTRKTSRREDVGICLSTVNSRLSTVSLIGTQKSSQKMLSSSKIATSNFLIGTPLSPLWFLRPDYVSFPKLLEFSLTPGSSTTSQFLIDNFCTLSASQFVQISNLESQTSSSNRHNPELEIELSCRKQRSGPGSNRHKFAFCNFRLYPLVLCFRSSILRLFPQPSAFVPRLLGSRLSTLNSQLFLVSADKSCSMQFACLPLSERGEARP